MVKDKLPDDIAAIDGGLPMRRNLSILTVTVAALAAGYFLVPRIRPSLTADRLHSPETRASISARKVETSLVNPESRPYNALIQQFPTAGTLDFKRLSEAIQNTGVPVFTRDYPWQVAIEVKFAKGWRCGGILISDRFILTAAHCLDGASAQASGYPIRIGLASIVVYHGGDGFTQGTPLTLDAHWPVTFHPKWKKGGPRMAWDAALLKLAQPVTGARPAPVRGTAFDSGDAITSGWGDYDSTNQPSPMLRAVRVPVVANDICRTSLAAANDPGAQLIGAYSLCAISQKDDACARDSGGPLVIGSRFRPQTIGIVSWGGLRDCGVAGPTGLLVGIYTRASEISDWVAEATGDPGTVTSQPPGSLFTIAPRNDI